MAGKSKESSADPKIFITKIIGGKVFTSIQDKSTEGESLLQTAGYSLIAEGENLGRVKSRITIQCPVCGCSKEKFEETGRFGCPDCYSAFGPFLPGLLRKMHKGTRHMGKIPARELSPKIVKGRIKLLSEELASAVKVENFEEASRLRDEIRSLEEHLDSGS